MFWRFGFASTSTLDALLDKPGLSVEDLLDEEDLLQECKAQNGKLIDFLCQTRVIKRLFDHVVGLAEVSGPGGREWEEKVRFKYPYVASEVLSSDIFGIVETSLNHPDEVLKPFWDAVLHSNPGHVQLPHPHHSHPLLAGSPSSSPVPPGKQLPKVHDSDLGDARNHPGGFGSGGAHEPSKHSSDGSSLVLVRATDNGPGKSVLAGYWAKVNGVFLDKKPREMLAYIRGLPLIVQRFVAHLETPSVVDLLYRIISCEQTLPAAGVIDWLSSEGLVPQIVELLSPQHSVDLHNTVSELIKAIIALSAPSPAGMGGGQDAFGYGGGGSGSFGQPDQPASVINKLVRELASESVVRRLVSFMLDSTMPSDLSRRLSEAVQETETGDGEDEDDEEGGGLSFKAGSQRKSSSAAIARGLGHLSTLNEDSALDTEEDADESEDPQPLNPSLTPAYESAKSPSHRDSTATVRPTDFFPPVKAPTCAMSPQTCSSALITGIGILIELIRKNNSDYFEQHLFHALRSHLLQRQQEISDERARARADGSVKDEARDDEDEEMEGMEDAMAEMTDKLGIVHLGPMLKVLCERLSDFQSLISRAPTEEQTLTTTLGEVKPLTFERYRITELYAELLHCSNMALLNRAPGEGPQYSADGILQGGIQGLQTLARTLQGSEADADDSIMSDRAPTDPLGSALAEDMSDTGPAASASGHAREQSTLGEEGSTGSTDLGSAPATQDTTVSTSPTTGQTEASDGDGGANAGGENDEDSKSIRSALSSMSLADLTSPYASEPASPNLEAGNDPIDENALIVGDLLKKKFLDVGIIPSILELFFEFPWNNFLHNVVYDILQQCFNGRMDTGLNRKLTLAVFESGKLPERILDGHKRNELSMAGPRRIRLGFMGHMNLIAEEMVKLLDRYPTEIAEAESISTTIPQPQWNLFVREVLQENREKEAAPLAGGRPNMGGGGTAFGNTAGSGDAGEGDFDDQSGNNEAFASYLSSQMSARGHDDDDDDSDDDSSSWLGGRGPASGASAFDDVFEPGAKASASTAASGGSFGNEDEDDEWGPFGDSSAAEGAGRGDVFGDFQSSSLSQPLTSADWAATSFDDDDDEDDELQSAEGEDPTTKRSDEESVSSASPDQTPFVDLSDASTYRELTRRRASSGGGSAEGSAGIAQFRQSADGTSGETISAMQQQHRRGSVGSSSGSTDPSAAQAADSSQEPLGPGVPSDASVKDGMIERTLPDGSVVSVPLDDVALAKEAEEGDKDKEGE